MLRVCAALLVLLSHCFVLATGRAADEPGRDLVGLSLGDIAVDLFVIVSSFRVTKSIARLRSLATYALARGLRIYSGLWVSLLLTAIRRQRLVQRLDPGRCARRRADRRLSLEERADGRGAFFWTAGAFPHSPYPSNVNASLWTLPLEIWMYLILAASWRPPGGRPRGQPRRASVQFAPPCRHVLPWSHRLHRSVPILFRHWIAACAVLLLAACTMLPHLGFKVGYRLVLTYLALYIAFIPGGFIRRYNAQGDYSYGIYIYAFSVQRMVASGMPGVTPRAMFCLASAVTIALSVMSWHLVEKWAPAWCGRLEQRLSRART